MVQAATTAAMAVMSAFVGSVCRAGAGVWDSAGGGASAGPGGGGGSGSGCLDSIQGTRLDLDDDVHAAKDAAGKAPVVFKSLEEN